VAEVNANHAKRINQAFDLANSGSGGGGGRGGGGAAAVKTKPLSKQQQPPPQQQAQRGRRISTSSIQALPNYENVGLQPERCPKCKSKKQFCMCNSVRRPSVAGAVYDDKSSVAGAGGAKAKVEKKKKRAMTTNAAELVAQLSGFERPGKKGAGDGGGGAAPGRSASSHGGDGGGAAALVDVGGLDDRATGC
jgi:hypothetical protein